MVKRKLVRRSYFHYEDQLKALRDYKRRVYHDEDAPVDAILIRQALDEWLERNKEA